MSVYRLYSSHYPEHVKAHFFKNLTFSKKDVRYLINDKHIRLLSRLKALYSVHLNRDDRISVVDQNLFDLANSI